MVRQARPAGLASDQATAETKPDAWADVLSADAPVNLPAVYSMISAPSKTDLARDSSAGFFVSRVAETAAGAAASTTFRTALPPRPLVPDMLTDVDTDQSIGVAAAHPNNVGVLSTTLLTGSTTNATTATTMMPAALAPPAVLIAPIVRVVSDPAFNSPDCETPAAMTVLSARMTASRPSSVDVISAKTGNDNGTGDTHTSRLSKSDTSASTADAAATAKIDSYPHVVHEVSIFDPALI